MVRVLTKEKWNGHHSKEVYDKRRTKGIENCFQLREGLPL